MYINDLATILYKNEVSRTFIAVVVTKLVYRVSRRKVGVDPRARHFCQPTVRLSGPEVVMADKDQAPKIGLSSPRPVTTGSTSVSTDPFQ